MNRNDHRRSCPDNRSSSSWACPDPESPLSPAILAGQLGWDLEEGDDLHPAANVAKMQAGTPLTDEDRWPWLDSVAGLDQRAHRGRAARHHHLLGAEADLPGPAARRQRGLRAPRRQQGHHRPAAERQARPLHADRPCSIRRSTPWNRRDRTRTPWSSTSAGGRPKRRPRSSSGSACWPRPGRPPWAPTTRGARRRRRWPTSGSARPAGADRRQALTQRDRLTASTGPGCRADHLRRAAAVVDSLHFRPIRSTFRSAGDGVTSSLQGWGMISAAGPLRSRVRPAQPGGRCRRRPAPDR